MFGTCSTMAGYDFKSPRKSLINFCDSCSSAEETEEGELDPDIKAQREKERRQANNARERCESIFQSITTYGLDLSILLCLAYILECVSNNNNTLFNQLT